MIKSVKKFYRQRFKGKLFIIKASGRIITDKKARRNLLENIQALTKDGVKILLIYGAGEAIDEALTEAGRTPKKINGRRITSKEDILLVKKTLAGDLGFRLLETMKDVGLNGYGLNALPPDWVGVRRRPKLDKTIRFDGEITDVHKKEIGKFFQSVSFAACPCLGIMEEGTSLNINADNVAIALAVSLKASKLVLLTDVDGVKIKGKVASVLSAHELEGLIEDGTVTGGMRVKLESCIEALRSGVKRVHILNGFHKDVLREEIYTSSGAGTMIVRRREKERYEAEEISKGEDR